MTVLTSALRSRNVDPAFLECMSKIILEPLEVLHPLRRSVGWWSSFWTCGASSATEDSAKSPTCHSQITRTRDNVNSGFAGPNRF